MAEESHNETLSENPVNQFSYAAVRPIFLAKPQQAVGTHYCEIGRSCYVAHTFMAEATGLVD